MKNSLVSKLQFMTLLLSSCNTKTFFSFFFFFFFLGVPLQHFEVPRVGVKRELQLLAYCTATAPWVLGHTSDLHHSSPQRQILNPLSETRD